MAIQNYPVLTDTLTQWIRDIMTEAGVSRLSVDVSGGVDSAVTAALAVRAAGTENVIGIYSSCHSTQASQALAQRVSKTFGFNLIEYNLEAVFENIVEQCKVEFERLGLTFPEISDTQSRTVFGSLRSTLRAPVGRFTNRAFGGGLRVGTGNRDEDQYVRFYQKGGDGEVDMNPIAGLFKSEVWELAKYLGVPQAVIDATPTPDLWGNSEHTDEGELEELLNVSLTYTRPGGELGSIEWVSREDQRNHIIVGENAAKSLSELRETFGYTEEQTKLIDAVRYMERITHHKAEPPPFPERDTLINAQLVD
jgi:NAD+ synthetase